MWRSVLFSHNTFDGFDHQIRSLDLNEVAAAYGHFFPAVPRETR
jgi:hypothetical protein